MLHALQAAIARHAPLRYGVAVAATSMAIALKFILRDFVVPAPFLFFLAATILSAWLGGPGAGLTATILSATAAAFWFIPEGRAAISIHGLEEVLSIAVFLVEGTVITFFVAGSRRALDTARREIDERKRIEAERELFLAALGHDLRNPLQSIKISADLALRQGLPEPTARTVGRMASSADRMGRLIAQLLDFARARSGRGIPVELARVELTDVVREVVDEFEPTCRARGCTVEVDVDDNPVGLLDRDRLIQVVQNLIANAVEHGVRSQPIQVRIRAEKAGYTSLEVCNAASPIPPELLAHLFEPFRGGRSTGKGLGLGLFIAHQIVAAHGGTIEVRSTSDHVCFVVMLPNAPDGVRRSFVGDSAPAR
jgi:signal transduction histidine kinase